MLCAADLAAGELDRVHNRTRAGSRVLSPEGRPRPHL
jgi:hypothetical protein